MDVHEDKLKGEMLDLQVQVDIVLHIREHAD